MRTYIIGNDGIALCRETPAAVNDGEMVVSSKEELLAAQLNGKRLLALWNALPGVEKRRPLTGHFEVGRSAIADAAHIPEPVRRMILQPLALHSPDAASSARSCVGWFELQLRLPICLCDCTVFGGASGNAVSNVWRRRPAA